MDRSKISTGELVAAAAAFLLFLVMFLPWYGLKSGYGLGSDSASAWRAFGLIDVLLLLTVLAIVALVLARALGAVPARLAQPPEVVIAAAAAVAFVLVLFRLLFTPGLGALEIVTIDRRIGVYLAFLLTIAMVWGGWTAMQERTEPRARRSLS